MLHIYEDNEASGGYGIGVKSKDTWMSVASSYGGLLPDMSYGELIMGNEGISSQEAAYGSTSIALSISGKAELFRLLEGSKTPALSVVFNYALYIKWYISYLNLPASLPAGFGKMNGDSF